MNKKTLRIAGWALGLSMAVAGVGVAVGASAKASVETKATLAGTEVSFTLSSASNVTSDGINVSFAKGSGSTAPTWYDAGLRLYSSNTITISSTTRTITGIEFSWEKQGSKAFASATASSGSYSHPATTGTGTWTGSAESITITLGGSGQLQLNTFSVYYGTAEATLGINDFGGTYKTNYILPGQSGSFAYTWSPANLEPEYASSGINWSTTSDKITLDSQTGAFTASSEVVAPTEVTVNLRITDSSSKTYDAIAKTFTICPHALNTSIGLARTSLKYTFTVDESFTVYESASSKLTATFLDTGEVDVLNTDSHYGGTLSYKIGDASISEGDPMRKAYNGQKCDITYTFGGATISLKSKFDITVNDKEVTPGNLVSGWNRMTKSSAALAAGDTVIITAQSSAVAMSTTQNNNNRGQASISKASGNGSLSAAPGDSVEIFTIEAGTVANSFSFKTRDDKYIYAASSSNNYLRTEETKSANSSFAVSFDASGNATLTAKGSNSHNLLQYNSSNSIFSCYSSSQSAVAIYRLSEPTNNDYLQDWVYNYMHFNDVGTLDHSDGTACKGVSGYYLTAKAALNTLESAHNGCMALLQSNDIFNDAQDRYEAWAIANNDAAPYDGNDSVVSTISSVNRIWTGHDNSADTSSALPILLVTGLGSAVAAGGIFLLARKRRDEE